MERRRTMLMRQVFRATGFAPAVLLALGLGLMLAGGEPERAEAPVEAQLAAIHAPDEAAARTVLPAGTMVLTGVWMVAGGLGWAGFGAWRAMSALRAARRGEVREARVTAHGRIGRRRGAPRRLAWCDARGQRGLSRPRADGALEGWPVGSLVVVYADPLTGRGWWEEDL